MICGYPYFWKHPCKDYPPEKHNHISPQGTFDLMISKYENFGPGSTNQRNITRKIPPNSKDITLICFLGGVSRSRFQDAITCKTHYKNKPWLSWGFSIHYIHCSLGIKIKNAFQQTGKAIPSRGIEWSRWMVPSGFPGTPT